MTSGGHIGRAATVGMFDGVHLGHRLVVDTLCAEASARGLLPTVFSFNRHPLAEIAPARTPRALSTIAQRTNWLVEAGAREVVVLRFDSTMRRLAAREFMRRLHTLYDVRLLVMGFNHSFGSDRLTDIGEYRRLGHLEGIEVVNAGALESAAVSVSSSAIRAALREGDVALASMMLGRAYAISGVVGHGRAIGHTIGFPTANLMPWMPNQLIPAPGVYAGDAITPHGRKFQAMINIGTNPTVSHDNALKIEAHLLGYSGDLYGQPITVTFRRRLRDERKFGSVAELRGQLEADREEIIKGPPREPFICY